ncbi:hypothetical protein [Azospirillum sp. sgz301742]
MSTSLDESVVRVRISDVTTKWREATLDTASTAFGLSAATVIIFNTLLAWVKDSYEPLNSFMAALTGHHWITHGLVDVLLFFGLGAFFMARHVKVRADALMVAVVAAAVLGGAGLAGWFLFV